MLNDIRFENVIAKVVEGTIMEDPTKVLYVHTDYRINHDRDYDTQDIALGVHHLFYAPTHTVTVLAGVDDRFLVGRVNEPRKWFRQSRHDSCWRTDGMRMFSSIYDAVTNVRFANKELRDIIKKLYPDEMSVVGPQPKTFTWIQKISVLSIDEVKNITYEWDGYENPLVNKWYYEQC